MNIAANDVRYHVEIFNKEKQRTIVFLHGFTGNAKTWNSIIEQLQDFKIVLLDLIGHGQSDSPESAERYAMERQIEDLNVLFNELTLTGFTLVGYSMGGRTALAYACTYPGRVEALILESASPGLQTTEEQKDRQERDAALARRILSGGIPDFVGFWENIPLFDSQKQLPDTVKQAVRQERLAQSTFGLANSLLGMGTGSQASYWGVLKDLKVPVLLLAGTLDLKFKAINEEMFALLPNARLEILEAGHAIHVEKPLEFATMVKEYLTLEFRGGTS
ncbi:2-succinyl-6-hydroxy-2,4-cyclohexadiene-1-carboxylate synthase [Planomicrobium sp. CPCC 101079]|uniref:2-succinyl-6-hydroxy-2, 4-cyclohexadiene-1-carboxylate synthase n=1 Tax=Planomicrobium sp. CPCC 101079 TaxID=2599618 RepID=UPI0011B6706E|nr:2-succinyl-6-hydroxy-2,4-cyclohexadiene-1-carboxylate synthase [Planomicrobium sp. CPCC 101079]TWT12521.1 2-succinyl-6-hydroxy-2,4-cyclohexadiene-1-carboxylate synthase [Planomicrobium sp. CPCC 101079]